MNVFSQLKKYRNYIIALIVLSSVMVIPGALIKLETGGNLLSSALMLFSVITFHVSLLLFLLCFVNTKTKQTQGTQ